MPSKQIIVWIYNSEKTLGWIYKYKNVQRVDID